MPPAQLVQNSMTSLSPFPFGALPLSWPVVTYRMLLLDAVPALLQEDHIRCLSVDEISNLSNVFNEDYTG